MPWPTLQRLRSKGLSWRDYQRLRALNRRFAQAAPPARGAAVWFFNASARLWGLSQNAAFQWLTAWSLRLRGIPVRQWVCQAGLPRCVLAAAQDEGRDAPPCAMCQAQSARLYPPGAWNVVPIHTSPDPAFARAIAHLPLDALLRFTWADLPLGEIITPSLRWALRRHNLPDTPTTRALARAFLTGAWNLARAVQARLDHERPRAAVVFNGQFYPEATLAYLTRRAGIPTITHEVGLRPLTAFFTHGEATAYPIELPDDFELSPQQEARLNAYLSRRFQGDFTMAGIRFWPDMRGLDEAFLAKAARFRALVPIFTNVVFDTSQKHANVLFPHMFAWLDGLRAVIQEHPEVLFVLRAHPDEQRPGKAARESVRAWVQQHQIHTWP
ncbi:MAG: hypothetical protein GXO54_01145, partial [Chloroflexi bacterium]|nr:hypothetical protein [Chloroflexota bacterium]